MSNLALSKIASFTRGTLGTCFTAAGLMMACDHNLLAWSEDFTKAQWVLNNVTPSASAIVSPAGTLMPKLVETAANATHCLNGVNVSVLIGQPYTISCFAKAGERPRLDLQWAPSDKFGTLAHAIFDLSAGIVVSTAGGVTATITPYPNGVYRLTMTATATVSGTTLMRAMITEADNTQVYAGDGASGLYLSNPQLNNWPTATNYVATAAAAIYQPRIDYDPATLTKRGLLVEEQRANLMNGSMGVASMTQSACTSTANAATFLDGTQTATLIKLDSTSAVHGVYQGQGTVAVSTTYCLSMFVKSAGCRMVQFLGSGPSAGYTDTGAAIFDLTLGTKISGSANAAIVNCGNGWYRIWTVVTTAATSPALGMLLDLGQTTTSTNFNFLGDGTSGIYAGGMQVEQASFPTSYIPTYGAQVTRAADQMNIANLAPWFNAQQGTLYAEYFQPQLLNTATTAIVEFDDDSPNNRFTLWANGSTSGKPRGSVLTASVAQFGSDAPVTPALGALVKSALAYAPGDVAFVANGGAPLTSATVALPAVTMVRFGVSMATGIPLNGWLRKFQYYPTRLPNSQLQTMTT
jgi:hypothetical protein